MKKKVVILVLLILVVNGLVAADDKNLKEKLVALRQQTNAVDRQHTASIRELRALIEVLQERVAALEEQIAEPESKRKIPAVGELPLKINGVEDLKAFIRNHPALGETWAKGYFPEKKIACALLRDQLANHYQDIERVNDQGFRFAYQAGEEKHRDAVVVIVSGQAMIFDFCIGSSDPGNLWDSLCWSYEEVTPW